MSIGRSRMPILHLITISSNAMLGSLAPLKATSGCRCPPLGRGGPQRDGLADNARGDADRRDSLHALPRPDQQRAEAVGDPAPQRQHTDPEALAEKLARRVPIAMPRPEAERPIQH